MGGVQGVKLVSAVCCYVCLCLDWLDDEEGGVSPALVERGGTLEQSAAAVPRPFRPLLSGLKMAATAAVDCVCCCLRPATSSSSSSPLPPFASTPVTLLPWPCASRWIMFAASQESSVSTRRLSTPPPPTHPFSFVLSNSFEGFFSPPAFSPVVSFY